ncbi:uncharacterized protein TRAVEDRAFT_54879 [Trametes versicolor FP-101664 SS1]|uniref:Uncharacterized protein n=1 Tax=Trametes versicolor (strain FP-101664) TaxID=717944 RepID=R7S5Z6_TRAVS|nr:uncharacterized protein TRAVEDRAFT_54879 [Trametes versicolor FP-101664 SS1]EIW51118.1 hypothetical protein TRAVEDRAFT_54879 [Trametes versicolor FP-101664 SS1]
MGGYKEAKLPIRAEVIRSRSAGNEEVEINGIKILRDYLSQHPPTAPQLRCNSASSSGQQKSVARPQSGIPAKRCSACSNVGDGVIACTQIGCRLSLCVPYGSNQAAACIEPPSGVSMTDFMNTFMCPACYKSRSAIAPYRLTSQGLAPLAEKCAVDHLVAVFLYLDDLRARDQVFATLRHDMGMYHKGLITYSAKLTIANTRPDHQEQGFAGLAKQIAGARGAATPFVLFISTHSDPDGLLTINIPRTIAAELGYRDMDGIAIPAGVLLYRFLGKLWNALPVGTGLRGLFLIVCGAAITNATQFGLISRLVTG